jgi:peptidoglycan/xylan/chitin deacetylase (PgdA/CDA1 family)
VGRHKTTWGAEVKNSKRILLARKSWRNLLIRRGPDWERAARGLAKRILPRDRDSDVPAARAAQAAGGLKPTLLRQVGAEVYVRSGLPGVVRRLREKRSAGAARILYYHRVNDDRDPFFEAIPVGLFERQMRYLARHYKVVSMPELMRHLTEGSSDSVVAVTFDDGYQDNYANAYPILKRYNLPATIFLTTGSLDSGEPLWFEQIAGAIKTTKCESLDLEVDIPRRFWLRTVTERIASNDQIFRVLRQLDDAGRRQWVAEILRSLEAPELENGRMLSWEQVRAMKQNGIDFGGHTVTHPFLSRLAPDAAAWEVSECKRRIEEELQHPVEFFAYPNGREEDFNPCNKEILRSAGYRAAVTTIWGLNYPSTDRLELRRGGPWEDSAAIFASKLDWYQLVNQ